MSDEARKVVEKEATGPLSSRRYEIRRVLGKGGMGTVYEAFDSKDRTLVALKTIDSREAEHLYRLKHEFRALADVQHENIVRYGELSHEDGQWFFSMELVRGTNLLDYVRPHASPTLLTGERESATTTILQHLVPESGIVQRAATPRVADVDARFDEGRLRATLAQLVSALATIHEAGHVHRDVKPFNVLVTDEGRVVLLDFGLVAALAEPRSREELDWVAGTPAFMAPEQVSGEAGGPEADWYAVGVILYLALTGTYPFDGDVAAIFKAKRELEARPPRERVASVPEDLNALCKDLLRRAPSERPSADAIRARLGIASPRGGAFPPVFVGRSGDMAVLSAAYADVRAGRGRIVFVEGEPGVGKSALVHHFLGAAAGAPVVLAGRCYEQETVPFKGLDGVVDALSEHLLTCGSAELGALLAGGVRYLATVFPVLARVPGIAGALVDGRGVENETGLRNQAFREFERLIDALASRSPLVFYVDDVQWADADSLALLQRVLLRPNGAPCMFVATLRTGMDMPGLAELLAHGTRLTIGGLDEAESRALWDALRPLAATEETASRRDAAVQEAAGHPLFLAELARAARAGHGGERHIRLQDVLWRRVQERDALERPFLEMVALAGAPTPCETLAAAAGLDAGECLSRLGSLKAAQLVRVTRRGEERLIEPYHDRIRESVVERLQGGEAGARDIAERHLRLGRALRDATAESALPQRVFAILHHLDAARALIVARKDLIEVAALHLTASRAARLATAYDRARDHAVAGLALAGESGWRDAYPLTTALSIQRMEAEYLAGDRDGARRSFESVRPRLGSLKDKVTLYTAWLALESTHMRFAEALVVGREILSELGAPLPARVSMAHVLAEYAANRVSRGRRSIDDLAGLPPLRDPARESAMKILIALAPAAYVSNTNLLTWIMLRIAGVSMRHGVSDVSSYGFAGYGMVLSAVFGKRDAGVAFGRLALALNDRFGNTALAGKVHFINASYLVVWTLPLPAARAALEQACAEALRSGDQPYEIYAVLHTTILTFFEGSSLEVLQATAERGQELSARRREADMADDSNSAIARYAAFLRGLTPPAPDSGTEGSSGAALADKTILTHFFYNYCRADVAYLSGETDLAEGLLRDAVRIGARAIFGTIMIVELAWLEALVAARRFDAASIEARPRLLWTVGARVAKLRPLARANPESFEGHYRLALAELLRISGRPERARVAVERAIEAARAQGSLKREAIGLDLAASYARTERDFARAEDLRRRADEAYRHWGAVALAGRRGA